MEGLLVLESRGGRPRSRASRGRVIAIAAGASILLIVLLYVLFLQATTLSPPRVDAETRRAAVRPVEVTGPRAAIGPNWMSKERGIWEIHLEGKPYELGWAHTRLGTRLLYETEEYMFSEMSRYVPSRIARFLIRTGVRWKYRRLDAHVPPERRLEIAGMADGVLDAHSDFLPTYQRFVFYHALHDITQDLETSPLLACSAFAASRGATVGGRLIIGRNFDFEGPPIFDREKAVLFFKAEGKIPFASVAWTGMGGVVTGLNSEGIFVSINAARTDDKGGDGMPVELLVREVLERAHTLDEAIAIIKKTPVMVPDFYLLGEGKTGEHAVVERSPTKLEVRRTGLGRDTTLVTNHALTQTFASDAENDRLKRYLTSGARYQRLQELTQRHRGAIDPKRALEILRDKRGAGGEPIGLGNRNALDAIIATHGVVVDAQQLMLWVGVGPHLTGRFVGFDLRKELLGEDRPNPPDLAADPIVDTDEYRAFTLARASLEHAERLLGLGERDRAVDELERAAQLADLMPEPHRLLGDLYRARGDAARARKEYQRFVELQPASLKDLETVKGILGTM